MKIAMLRYAAYPISIHCQWVSSHWDVHIQHRRWRASGCGGVESSYAPDQGAEQLRAVCRDLEGVLPILAEGVSG